MNLIQRFLAAPIGHRPDCIAVCLDVRAIDRGRLLGMRPAEDAELSFASLLQVSGQVTDHVLDASIERLIGVRPMLGAGVARARFRRPSHRGTHGW